MDSNPQTGNPFSAPKTTVEVDQPMPTFTGNESMAFRYFVDEKDVVKLYQYQTTRMGLARMLAIGSSFVTSACAAIALFVVIVVSGNDFGSIDGFSMFLCAMLCARRAYYLSPWGRRYVARKQIMRFVSADPQSFLGDLKLLIDPTGLRMVNSMVDTLRNWNSAMRVDRTQTYVYVFAGALVVCAIPRDAFETDEQEGRLIGLVRHYVEKSELS